MRVLFYLSPYISPTHSEFQHNSINLGEGMRKAGIEFYGNIDYWYENDIDGYLFRAVPNGYNHDVAIYSTFYFNRYPERISDVDYSKINVLIDAEDGLFTHCFKSDYKRFNCILRTHYNKNLNYPKNVYPWVFGLSERIIKEVENIRDIKPLNRIYNNFRVSQNLRTKSIDELSPVLSKKYVMFNYLTDQLSTTDSNDCLSYWSQTGRRHNEEYYRLLNSSMLTFVFGGIIDVKPIGKDYASKMLRQLNKLMSKLYRSKRSNFLFIYQYDSWRLWESLVSNTCPIHVDFEEWGFEMPYMPENGKHYIGVRNLDFKKAGDMILDLTDNEIKEIAENGKKWVLEHYNTKRLFELLKELIDN
ncbi:MAG: hypothetical protein A2X12_10210 [Bacteroidetes bacterium GWE2_29_8]|nr:MAG: hypothetical protein A2X12_10210 [Bacteroidetes bacterium GWE2_29_8]OFY18996.1 MAG: hypothetical protein A2X02_03395 [Bacteroidetes bacterium GWF2_29_10]